MITGSSAFKLEETKQIRTPDLRVTLQENLNVKSRSPFIDMNIIKEAVIFGDKVVTIGLSNFPDYNQTLQSYSLGGETRYINASYSFNHLVNNGATLVGYRINNDSIYREYSTDGITFMGGETLLSGISTFSDIAVTGDSQIYLARFEGQTTFSNFDTRNNYSIYSMRNIGSWGITQIYQQGDYINSNPLTSPKVLLAANVEDGLDRLFWIGGKADSGDGIKTMDTDGLNIFKQQEIISSRVTGLRRNITIKNFTKTESNEYWIPISINDNYIEVVGGVTTNFDVDYNLSILKSTDFRNWSVFLTLPTDQAQFSVASGGSLGNELTIYGSSAGNNYDILLGTSQLDISDNILSYNNTDNDRVTLDVGNYKGVTVAAAETYFILQENGDKILQENGDGILLETAP